jgi:hypothetical protein
LVLVAATQDYWLKCRLADTLISLWITAKIPLLKPKTPLYGARETTLLLPDRVALNLKIILDLKLR